MQSPLEAAIAAANVSKKDLSHEIGVGTTTIWRACTGLAIEAESAAKLCERFPELDYVELTLGRGRTLRHPSKSRQKLRAVR